MPEVSVSVKGTCMIHSQTFCLPGRSHTVLHLLGKVQGSEGADGLGCVALSVSVLGLCGKVW